MINLETLNILGLCYIKIFMFYVYRLYYNILLETLNKLKRSH